MRFLIVVLMACAVAGWADTYPFAQKHAAVDDISLRDTVRAMERTREVREQQREALGRAAEFILLCESGQSEISFVDAPTTSGATESVMQETTFTKSLAIPEGQSLVDVDAALRKLAKPRALIRRVGGLSLVEVELAADPEWPLNKVLDPAPTGTLTLKAAAAILTRYHGKIGDKAKVIDPIAETPVRLQTDGPPTVRDLVLATFEAIQKSDGARFNYQVAPERSSAYYRSWVVTVF